MSDIHKLSGAYASTLSTTSSGLASTSTSRRARTAAPRSPSSARPLPCSPRPPRPPRPPHSATRCWRASPRSARLPPRSVRRITPSAVLPRGCRHFWSRRPSSLIARGRLPRLAALGRPRTTGALTAAEQVLQAPTRRQVSVDLGEAGKATIVRSSQPATAAVIITEDMVSGARRQGLRALVHADGDGSSPPG